MSVKRWEEYAWQVHFFYGQSIRQSKRPKDMRCAPASHWQEDPIEFDNGIWMVAALDDCWAAPLETCRAKLGGRTICSLRLSPWFLVLTEGRFQTPGVASSVQERRRLELSRPWWCGCLLHRPRRISFRTHEREPNSEESSHDPPGF